MEINIGDYVRTKSGRITKIKEFIKESSNGLFFNFYSDGLYGIEKQDIIKHSEDIIDLVENLDIVTICDNFGGHKLETYVVDNNSKENCIDILKSIIDKSGYSIEKILTHEQFESNAYKIEKESDK